MDEELYLGCEQDLSVRSLPSSLPIYAHPSSFTSPGLMNSLAGVISTLVNVYGVQDGEFNTTSIVTISVTGGVAVVCSLLSLWYGVWMLGRIKKRHEREIGIEKAGKHGEGMWAGFKEKVGKVGRRR